MQNKVYSNRRLFFLGQNFKDECISHKYNRLYNMLNVSFTNGKLTFNAQYQDLSRLIISDIEGDPIESFKQGDWVEILVTRPKDSLGLTIRLTRKIPPNSGGYVEKLLWTYGFTGRMRNEDRTTLFETYLPDYVKHPDFERGFSIIPGATPGKKQYPYFQGYKVSEGLILVFGSRTVAAELQYPVAYWIDKAVQLEPWKVESFLERHNNGTIPFTLGMKE